MPYATVRDVRGEGVTGDDAGWARTELLIEEASAEIDRLTGQFFEPRAQSREFDGRNTATVDLPVPLIEVDTIYIDGQQVGHAPEQIQIVGGPVGPTTGSPRLSRKQGRFPRGLGNVRVVGIWGYTEADGTAYGRTPLAIRRAVILRVLRWIHPLADPASEEARTQHRIIEERSRDQVVKFQAYAARVVLTGDPEVDELIAPFRRRFGVAVA